VRGDVYHLRAPRDAKGHEQKLARPCVVLQSDFLMVSTVIVASTSTSALPLSHRPAIEIDGRVTHVLVEQMAAVDLQRLGDKIGRLSAEELAAVDEAVLMVLGFD
jgi:mRNA interferase MazF